MLFEPLTPGEVADAIRTLTEDRRVATMAKVARYRVICVEPLVVKPPHWMAGHRLARVVVYDYSADRCVDACIDLDAGVVAHLDINRSQPMLSREEEALAITVALEDEQVRGALLLGEQPQLATHYWGRGSNDVAHARRSAAVLFGRPGEQPTVVAVVDLLDNTVLNVGAAEQW
jgi:Cu2+-containing amine oxidase